MDVLVMLEELSEHSTVLAHVNSVPSPLNSERPTRDVVTLYGEATPESLAMALAVAMESRRETMERSDVIRHLGLWPERGAIGDAAWRDEQSGQLVTRDLSIAPEVIRELANQLLNDPMGPPLHIPTPQIDVSPVTAFVISDDTSNHIEVSLFNVVPEQPTFIFALAGLLCLATFRFGRVTSPRPHTF
jgi:hypothetical protein